MEKRQNGSKIGSQVEDQFLDATSNESDTWTSRSKFRFQRLTHLYKIFIARHTYWPNSQIGYCKATRRRKLEEEIKDVLTYSDVKNDAKNEKALSHRQSSVQSRYYETKLTCIEQKKWQDNQNDISLSMNK